jgi:streptogrisin C
VVRCAIGFAVTTGFLTAAHCGEPGDTATGLSGGTGVFTAVAPSSGGALVTAADDWEPTPYVRSGGGLVPVRGSREAPVGASVCRYGPTTGVRCGVVQARDQTVVFPGGALHGLVRTSVCAEPGRADGPFLSGGQAQGVAVGGAGSCATGGTTFLAPVNPMLSQWGLTLATA